MRFAKAVFAGLFAAFVVYLSAAFMGWDFNPGNWDILGRCLAGIFMGFCAVIVGLLVGGVIE